MCLRTTDGREVGRLLGFVIEPGLPRIRSLVVDSAGSAREVPMDAVRFDPSSLSLRIVSPTADADQCGVAFAPGTLPEISDEDLWIPIIHSAA
jgi:hypothetical protein